jgi:mono/diheme cytochrome c family protein
VILAVTFRTILVAINVLAVAVIVGVIGYKVLSVRREPKEKPAPNLTPFLDDDELEGRHLERVLRWALLFSTIVAVVLPLYWLLEPGRQDAEAEGFEERAVERGAVLYANDQMEEYDAARSLLCADCHGTDGGGGSALYTITPDAQGDPEAAPIQVTWRAPALNTVFYKFYECSEADVADLVRGCARAENQVNDIITFGRPGTPMPAWGIAGGGPKNEQAISDIVEYLKSIQLKPKGARQQITDQVEELQQQAEGAVEAAEANLESARESLAEAKTAKAREKYRLDVEGALAAIERSREFEARIADASEGELLFDVNCARCHTKGWSYNNPSDPGTPPPAPPGSGAFGPSLRDGSTLLQFPGEPADATDTPGFQSQFDWVAVGVEARKGYGVRGISSGRMPHFGDLLTKAQINAIIRYERNL